jgi:hypothetical protein
MNRTTGLHCLESMQTTTKRPLGVHLRAVNALHETDDPSCKTREHELEHRLLIRAQLACSILIDAFTARSVVAK